MKLLSAFIGLLAITPVLANAGQTNKVIYGDDNRNDVVDYRSRKVVEASRSTVALLRSSGLTASGTQFTIDPSTYGEKMNLCKSERFYSQPAAAFCSGFLVAPNKIMTAGHCVTSHADCGTVRFVFDYKMINQDRAQTVFTENQIYSCKKVIGWKKDNQGADFAVIELDREVTDREPLKLSDNRDTKVKTSLLVIGHPSGLPTKITDKASVRSVNRDAGYLMANLDTYGGNSGSAVLNTETLEVEGILVRGETDFIMNGSCRASYRVGDNAGRGEDVTLISVVEENGGFDATVEPTLPTVPTTPITGSRYVWLTSDNTCNEFVGSVYIREVADSLCQAQLGPVRYVWLTSDATCNEFRGSQYIREVSNALCGAAATAGMRYVWLTSDMTCNLFNGNSYIREVADSLCGHK